MIQTRGDATCLAPFNGCGLGTGDGKSEGEDRGGDLHIEGQGGFNIESRE